MTLTGYSGDPGLVTENAVASGLAELSSDNASLNVSVIVVPALFVTADCQVGGVISRVELFNAVTFERLTASLPAMS